MGEVVSAVTHSLFQLGKLREAFKDLTRTEGCSGPRFGSNKGLPDPLEGTYSERSSAKQYDLDMKIQPTYLHLRHFNIYASNSAGHGQDQEDSWKVFMSHVSGNLVVLFCQCCLFSERSKSDCDKVTNNVGLHGFGLTLG